MLTLRRFNTTVVFTALAVLLMSAVWGYTRQSVHGFNDKVYWDVTVEGLRRSGSQTYSDHQYYIENDNEDGYVTLIEQEFKHRVMQTFPDEPGKSDTEKIVKRNGDMTKTVKIPAGTSIRREYPHEVDISGLGEGWYYIDAYTRINLKDISEDPTPKAEDNTKSSKFYIP